MSGSVHYLATVSHVYQRKFRTDELARALRGHNLYLISRRPLVRIKESSIRRLGSDTMFELQTLRPDDGSVAAFYTVGIGDSGTMVSSTFRSHMSGSYFSMRRRDGQLVHGDAWALASLLLNVPPGLADHEVLYVGQAYGKDGERTAYDRTRDHTKLQHIYEDHAGEAWDIFVSPIIIESTNVNNWDHLPDDKEGFDLDQAMKLVGGVNLAPKTSVDLVEHALITAFQGPYNETLRQWTPANPTRAMRRARDVGFRLLTVSMHALDGLARYYSAAIREAARAHNFYLGLSAAPKRPSMGLLDPSEWEDPVMHMEVNAHSAFAQVVEFSEAHIRWFGSAAPPVRKPPEVQL
jgi:hypothetical protein